MDSAPEPQVGVIADAVNTDMAGQQTDTTKRIFNALSKLAESDSEPEMDTQPRPPARTNLVSRLKLQLSDDSSESSEDEEDDGNAYERVKRMLMSAPEEKTPQTKAAQHAKQFSASSSEDEEEMPGRRQRVLRKERSESAKASSPTMVRSRTPSPGLFVTPDASPVKKATRTLSASDKEEEPAKDSHNKDLEERVRRIRAERLALQKKERQAERRKDMSARRDAGSDTSDGESGRRLTQSTRPARKAGKKALEEMAREQQRISRNMQLTHQVKTKKKYSTKDLLLRFAPAQAGATSDIVQSMPTPAASSVHHSSEAELRDTPPSSPPTQKTDLLELRKLGKGKGRANEPRASPQPMAKPQSTSEDAEMVELSDSDDELQKSWSTSRFPVFDKIPQSWNQQAESYVLLRHLAHLTSPGKMGSKGPKSMNMTELQASLAQKAREQALEERLEKIEDLKRRGIHIETEEEREKHQLEVEDLVAQFEKAREEDRKLAKREHEEAKKNGETVDELPSSDESDDEDYVGSGDEGAVEQGNAEGSEAEAELELSGSSEDEEMGEVDEDDEPDEMAEPDGLIGNAAAESQDDADRPDDNHDVEASDAEEEGPLPPVRAQTGKRSRHVVLDDEDDDHEETENAEEASAQATQTPSQPQEIDAMAAFGFDNPAGGIGLTQAFASSMANLNSKFDQVHALDNEPEQDSMDFFKSLPETQAGASFADPADLIVPNSQQPANQRDEFQASLGMGSLMQMVEMEPTQRSETFEPTQDTGFQLPRSPAGLDQPPSTINTVMLAVAESPMPKRKGRLQRGRRAVPELSDIDDDADVSDVEAEHPHGTAVSEDAFAILAKAAKRQKKLAEKFNKKTSWAKEAIQEQAEESEDEYAGLGGVSDEDSGEDDEELAKMIDTNDVKVNERELAAFYAYVYPSYVTIIC